MRDNTNQILRIEESSDTPGILLDAIKGLIRIEGSSFPENALSVYNPILDWLEANKDLKKDLTCEFHYHYINSASKKAVYEVMRQIERLQKNGVNVIMKWFYEIADDDILDLGEEYSEIVNIPFEFIPVE